MEKKFISGRSLSRLSFFGLGGGFSLQGGISHLLNPARTTFPKWNYLVLGLAALFEGYSWLVARRELKSRRQAGRSVWQVIRASKDPTVFTIFLEDSAALVGIAIAFLGILFSHLFNKPYWDAIASLVIGLILFAVAIMLANESRELLLGERAHTEQMRKVIDLLRSDPRVKEIADLFALHFGPDQILLTASIRFDPDLRVNELERTIERLKHKIQKEEPAIKRIFIEAESVKKRVAA